MLARGDGVSDLGCDGPPRKNRLVVPKEWMIKYLIPEEFGLNVSLKECSRDFIEGSEVQFTVGNVEMLKSIVKLRSRNGCSFDYHFILWTFLMRLGMLAIFNINVLKFEP